MIYDSAVEQIKGARASESDMPLPALRLATVTSLSNGRAYIQFYGESAASEKLYPYLEGYKPTVGDKVLVTQQGSTYIILGKISKDNVVNNYYMTKALFDAAEYLTKAVADTLYMPIGGSVESARYVANNNYAMGFSNNTTNVLTPGRRSSSVSGKVSLGDNNNRFEAGYFDTVGYNSSSACVQTLNYKASNVYGDATPDSSDSRSFGTSSKRFKTMYLKTLYLAELFLGTGSNKLELTAGSSYGTIRPSSNQGVDLGTSSYMFRNVYAKQLYQNGTAISTSDRRKKTGIKGIGQKYIDFFRKLKPRLFRFKDGESGRLHSGFVAQEVEEAAAESGIPTKDLAFLCIDENGDYGLRYEELIAIQTQVIQDLMNRVEELEEIVKGGKR